MTQIEIYQMIWRGISSLLGPAFKMNITRTSYFNQEDYVLEIYTESLGSICNIKIENNELLLMPILDNFSYNLKRIDLHDPNQFDPINIVMDIEQFTEAKRKHRNERNAKWKSTPQKVAGQVPLPKEQKRQKVKKFHYRRHRRR